MRHGKVVCTSAIIHQNKITAPAIFVGWPQFFVRLSLSSAMVLCFAAAHMAGYPVPFVVPLVQFLAKRDGEELRPESRHIIGSASGLLLELAQTT